MFKQNSKYRAIYLISAIAAFAFGSAMAFYDYFDARDGMRLFGGVVFGLMAIFQAGDLISFYKNKKRHNSREV